jgi:hypothetical protein
VIKFNSRFALMIRILLTCCILVQCGLVDLLSPDTQEEKAGKEVSRTLRELQRFVIYRAEYENVSIGEVMDDLHFWTMELESVPKPYRLNFMLLDPAHESRRITLKEGSIRLDRLCEKIAGAAGLSVSFDEDAVIFKAKSVFASVKATNEKTPDAHTMALIQQVQVPIADCENASLEDLLDYLKRFLPKKADATTLAFSIQDPAHKAREITLRLQDIRLDYLCQRIAEQAGVSVSFGKDAIIFRAPDGGEASVDSSK